MLLISAADPKGTPFNSNIVDWNSPAKTFDLQSYRLDEYAAFQIEAKNGLMFTAIYDTRSYLIVEAIINLSRTIFVSVVLAISAIYFQKDANNLVLHPIERMLEKVRMIAKNPLAAASDEVEMAGVMTMMHKQEAENEKDSNLETAILEQAITKIGHLLALGFGEAGSTIIGGNMTTGGDLNPMMPGNRTYCIYGFCDIRQFTDSTEVLQTKVMTFVN